MSRPLASRLLPLSLALLTLLAQAQPSPPPRPSAPARPVPVVPAPPEAPLPPAPPEAPTEAGRVYTPGAFDRIELGGAARVTLVQGDRDQIFVAGDAQAQQDVDIRLSGGQLVVRTGGGWKFWSTQRVHLQIQVRQLRQLTISGSSDVQVPGPLNVDRLRLSINGAGQVRLEQLKALELVFMISGAGDGQVAGQTNELMLQISGKGKVMADGLRARRARVHVSGLGNVVLWATDELSAQISGVGSIDYFGNPSVQRSVSGMGNITARGEKKPSVDAR